MNPVKGVSDVSSYLELMRCIYIDACMKCPAEVSDLRDLKTIKSRVENEGLSFLTITLPNFAKAFERCLSLGFCVPAHFPRFRRCGAIPAFLRGLLGHVFDCETGRILDDVNSSIYVEAIRQICLSFKKIELPCSEERNKAAIETFIQVEQDFESFSLDPGQRDKFLRCSNALWHNLVASFSHNELVPRHGPGATAERIRGNSKYVLQFWHERLEREFPLLEYGYAVSASGEDCFEKVTFVPWDKEQPVRVTLVPKTLKSPRIIAIEPVCMQYAQQAVQSFLYEKIERYWLTRGHVNFTDQRINQRMALRSSRSGRWVTIDLSEASDRVPADLALHMFDSNPDLRALVSACRSYRAELPDGTVIGPLKKFASMGSALCFPVEAMYYYTICVMASLDFHNLSVSPENIFRCSKGIYVYGDDIIVPVDQAGITLDYLQKYNCKINEDKTFRTGKFRESCGLDAYDGYIVTPTYIRQQRPKSKQQAQEILSWVATANLFYSKGYWRTSSAMFRIVEEILGDLPYVSRESRALGRISFLGYVSVDRWDRSTHSFKVKAWVPRPVYRSDKIDGYSALQKCLLSLERRSPSDDELSASSVYDLNGLLEPPVSDRKHLERSARRGAVALQHRWVAAT